MISLVVTKVVAAVSAEATCGAILSSEGILMGRYLTNRTCSIQIRQSKVRGGQQSERTWDKVTLRGEKHCQSLKNMSCAILSYTYVACAENTMVNGKY
jgi:hypothetical protein